MDSGHVRPEKEMPMSFHDFQMASITGEQVGLDKFRDHVALVVNVASK